MKILLAAKCPPNGARKIGGVQSWCKTVGAELVRLGHGVMFWGPGQPVKGHYDLGIVANWSTVQPVLHRCEKVLTVCHGIIDAEQPPPNQTVVFTSEGVRDYWKGTGPIIRQPIDLDFWTPRQAEAKYLTRFSYRKGLEFIEEIARHMGLEYQHVSNVSHDRARGVIRQSACVLATGRAALEAMACGVPVVICDNRSAYQRALLDADILASMLNNYSGRGGVTPTALNVKIAIKEAMENGSQRAHVERFHDAQNVVKELLRVALQ